MPTLQADKLYRIKGVPIMRTGSFRDSRGRRLDVTDGYLKGLKERYDPLGENGHEARVKLGHTSKDTDPTNGYIESLDVRPLKEGGRNFLLAEYAAVPGSAVKQMLRSGPYPRRSVEIIDHEHQPYLGDSSHLGAARPAIKGMPAITMSQVVEMTADELAALSEHADNRFDTEGVLLFSADDDPQELTMDEDEKTVTASTTVTASAGDDAMLAEVQGLKAQLAEMQAQMDADKKFAVALTDATKFCETKRAQLGTVPLEKAALALAHANVHCPAVEFEGETVPFGEFVQTILAELPLAAPPAGLSILGGGKPKAQKNEHLLADDDWSPEALNTRAEAYAEEHKCSFTEAYFEIGKLAAKQKQEAA